MVCRMSSRGCLTGGSSRGNSRLVRCLASGGMGGKRRFHCLACFDFSIRPRSKNRQGLGRTVVIDVVSNEKRQHFFRTVCGPTSQPSMAFLIQRTASVNSHKASISHG